jgi:hypothetical protein
MERISCLNISTVHLDLLRIVLQCRLIAEIYSFEIKKSRAELTLPYDVLKIV